MSFRLPRGPKLVTLLYVDIERESNMNAKLTGPFSSSHDSHSSSSQRILNILQSRSKPASELVSDQNTPPNADEPSRVKQYLKEAATGNADQEPVFELEVVERSKATMDQWKVIASYLEKTKNELKLSRIEALKDEDGPIVVDWDDGLAVQNEEEVKQLVEKLISTQTGKAKVGNGCMIV
ncbi:uncharacterized protein FA14DRAFT_172846 [Meira miltonrushii]|uniref:Uncharacterized protein n=1 Tax=Meira miltonrushii TaxID=1280837 RepID=A0A316VFD3_9BASI|nr:uncharacterized protein FA14DRAFT_172846 [Meira miltonrushii]PWN36292.1 hypothetical protein FA14DRAFT_172846 [Meira miltonrushii]